MLHYDMLRCHMPRGYAMLMRAMLLPRFFFALHIDYFDAAATCARHAMLCCSASMPLVCSYAAAAYCLPPRRHLLIRRYTRYATYAMRADDTLRALTRCYALLYRGECYSAGCSAATLPCCRCWRALRFYITPRLLFYYARRHMPMRDGHALR